MTEPVFTKIEDGILHALTALIIFFVFVALIDSPTQIWIFKNKSINVFIAGILFFNSLHYYFAFFIFGRLPEYKKSLLKTNDTRNSLIFRSFIFIIFFLTWKLKDLPSIYNQIFMLIYLMYPKYHSLRQSNGLWLIFARKNSHLQKQQSKFFDQFAIWTLMFAAFFNYCYILKLGPGSYIKYLFLILYALSVLIFGCLILYTPIKLRIEKTMYSLRQIGNVICMYNPISVFCFRALHGLEYAFIVKKMLINSARNNRDLKLFKHFFIFTIAILPICIILHHHSAISTLFGINFYSHEILNYAIALDYTIQFFHYSLDSKMFEMKNDRIRSEIAPLIK